MALRHGKSVVLRPTGLSDTLDGSNAFAGAMQQLVNLVPDPSTDKVWQCRPGAVAVAGFPGIGNGFISGLLVVGNTAYGLMTTPTFPGFDTPFAFNLATNTAITVVGVTAANVPQSQPPSGDWTPPILAQVGTRIIVTDTGFGALGNQFGWFDVSGFSETTTGNVTMGSTIITGNPNILGVQPGMLLSALGYSLSGVVVLSTAQFVLVTAGQTHSNTTLDNLVNTTGVAIGQVVSGTGIIPGTTVSAIVSPTQVTLSQAAIATGTIQVTFSGGTITVNAPASSNNSATSVTVVGGTPAAPLWGAGTTDRNPLPSVPVGVAQFNGRAYYALGTNGIVFSDSGFPCRVSNNPNVQALTTNDGLSVTAIGQLLLTAPLTGGIVQALIVFEGVVKMQQITGDPTTNNLAMNAMNVATGTAAPLSITPTTLGLAFISPQGLRIVSFAGTVSDVIGAYGGGVSVPFINAQHPSRICAGANSGVLRISVPTLLANANATVEYWFDLTRKQWSGPHTFASSQIQPWNITFICAQTGVNGQLYGSDVYQTVGSQFLENGALLAWAWQTSMQPDNGDIAGNSLVEMTLACGVAGGKTISLSSYDMNGALLDSTNVGVAGMPAIFGQAIFGTSVFGDVAGGPFQQRKVEWTHPLVFKQLSVLATGASSSQVRLGNLYMRYQILGYTLEIAAPGPQPFYQLLSDAGVPLSSDTGMPLEQL